MILGIIPARGGSRRLPGKNLRLMCGRPLIAHTILEALKTTNLRDVYVTTEDDEIAEVSRDYGAKIIKRPRNLSHDKSIVYGAIFHAIDAVGGCDAVCLIQATSPLTRADDIDRTIDEYLRTGKPAMTVAHGESQANGSVYVGSVEWIRNGGNWDDGSPHWVTMPVSRSVDINTLSEFNEAETIMRGIAV